MTSRHPHTALRLAALAFVALLPLALAACGGDDDTAATTTAKPTTTLAKGPVGVSDVWARTATAGGNGAVYMVLKGGAEADALVGASVPADVAKKVEIHETVPAASGDTADTSMDGKSTTTAMGGSTTTAMGGSTTTAMGGGSGGEGGQMMTMRPVERIEVPAGTDVTLKPGGYHVMLFEVQKDLAVGDKVPVTLRFEKAGEVNVTAEVREH